MLTTTLNEIKDYSPCAEGWTKLLRSLDKTKADDDPLDIIYILESNGIEDAIWCLRCFNYKDYCLFLADVAESVLPLSEAKHPGDQRPRETIEIIRAYKRGEVTKEELIVAADAADAYAVADAAYYAAAYAATHDDAYAAYYAADAAARAAAHAAAHAVYAYAEYAYARKSKWQEIELMFKKHFDSAV